MVRDWLPLGQALSFGPVSSALGHTIAWHQRGCSQPWHSSVDMAGFLRLVLFVYFPSLSLCLLTLKIKNLDHMMLTSPPHSVLC